MSYNPNNINGQSTMANSAPVVIASNQSALPITGSQLAASTTAWTSATGLNTSNTIAITNLNTVSVTLSNTSTMTAGVLTFEVSPDGGTTWFSVSMARINAYTIESSYTLSVVANQAWSTSVDAFTNFRVRLSTVITGTGTATVIVAAQLFAIEPIITVGQTNAALLQATIGAALPVGANTIGAVNIGTLPTLTKGTQGATGFSIQDLRDSGRNTRIFMLDTITVAPVADALATVVQWYGNAAVAGTTTPAVVPAGKTLRLTGYKIQYQSLATVGYAVVRVRFNTGGVGAIGSPLVASFEAGSCAGATTIAMTGGVTTETGAFPEGLELPAGGGIAFSVAGYGPTGTLTLEGGVRFEVHAYEY